MESSPAEARSFPSGDHATLLTGPLWPPRVSNSCPLDVCHTLIVPSGSGVANRAPSGDRSKGVTQSGKLSDSRPVPASHAFTVPSEYNVNSRLPSRDQAT